MDASWVTEQDAKGRPRPAGDHQGDLSLDAEGLTWRSRGGTVRAPWEAIFGVFVLAPDDEEPTLFVLLPRRPPMPPWLRVHASGIPAALRPGGLEGLADTITARAGQRGYRDTAPRRPRLEPGALLEAVLAHREVPGALEVPVGPGPEGAGGRRRSIGRGMLAGAGVAVALTAALVSVPAMVPLLLVAGASGAVAGGFFSSGRARLARLGLRRGRRVLVLCPDGAVVGLPTGVRAFAWSGIGRFASEPYADPRRHGGRPRRCLEVSDAEGEVLGRIDEDWFAEPLPLILAVAEAYRKQVAPSAHG